MRLSRSTQTGIIPTCVVCAVVVVAQAGCAGRSFSPYTSNGEMRRQPERARELHAKATRIADEDPVEAERLLREALDADLYHGPSHNNLGILLLARGDLYDAAHEFEWARKLMPGHPSPRVNLAMTLERAGKVDDALDEYDSALAVFDGFLPAIQGKARLQVLSGRIDDETPALLESISLRGDQDWREWAKLEQIRLRRSR